MDSPQSQVAPDVTAVSQTNVSRWFAEEMYPHSASLRSYLRSAFPTVRDMDDVVQESLLRLWRARAQKSIRSARGFLFQIARNVAIDQIRRDRRAPIEAVANVASLPVPDDRPDPAIAACCADDIALLAEGIDRLPARCRQIFLLRKVQQMSQRDIAGMLGLSERTVQEQVARGMKRCEAFLAQKLG